MPSGVKTASSEQATGRPMGSEGMAQMVGPMRLSPSGEEASDRGSRKAKSGGGRSLAPVPAIELPHLVGVLLARARPAAYPSNEVRPHPLPTGRRTDSAKNNRTFIR